MKLTCVLRSLEKNEFFVTFSQELQSRVDELVQSEERVSDLNAQLRAQMSTMVAEYDEDKRQAVEK